MLKLVSKFCIISLLIFVLFYLTVLCGSQFILNSKLVKNNIEHFLSKKVCNPVDVNGLKFVVNYDLSFDLNVSNISSYRKNYDKLFYLENLSYKSKVLSLKPDYIALNNLYIDISENTCFKNLEDSSGKNKEFDLGYLPILQIKNIYIKLDKFSNVQITNLKTKKIKQGVIGAFIAKVVSPYSNGPVYIGKDGFILYTDSLFLDDISIEFPNSKLNITGDFSNLKAYKQAIPLDDVGKVFKYFTY